MPFTLTCSACAQPLQVKEEWAGKQVQCARCAAILTVPALTIATSPAVAPAPSPPPDLPAGPSQTPAAGKPPLDAETIPEAARGLGELLSVHHFPRPLFYLCWAAGAFSVLCGVAIALLLPLLPAPANSKTGTTASVGQAVLLGGLFALAGLGLIVLAQYRNACRVLFFSGGFADQRGRKCRAVRWEDVQAIWDYFYWDPWNAFRLEMRDGRSVKVRPGNTTKARELRERIENQIYAALFPEAMRRFKGGERLAFGPITISRDGLFCNGSCVPWERVTAFVLQIYPRAGSRCLEVYQEGSGVFCSVNTNQIPNRRLLHRLAQEARPGLD